MDAPEQKQLRAFNRSKNRMNSKTIKSVDVAERMKAKEKRKERENRRLNLLGKKRG